MQTLELHYPMIQFLIITDIHLLVFYILKGSLSQSAPVLLYVMTIQDVEGYL